MKKTLMLCLLAGGTGALVTLLLVDPPELGNRSLAQDFFRYSENAQAAAPAPRRHCPRLSRDRLCRPPALH